VAESSKFLQKSKCSRQ